MWNYQDQTDKAVNPDSSFGRASDYGRKCHGF